MSEVDPVEIEQCRALAAAWAPMLRALGHSERLLIVLWLAGGERSVRELEDVTGLGQSAVSYHLGQLRTAELVIVTAHGRSNHYRLASTELDDLATRLGTVLPRPPASDSTSP